MAESSSTKVTVNPLLVRTEVEGGDDDIARLEIVTGLTWWILLFNDTADDPVLSLCANARCADTQLVAWFAEVGRHVEKDRYWVGDCRNMDRLVARLKLFAVEAANNTTSLDLVMAFSSIIRLMVGPFCVWCCGHFHLERYHLLPRALRVKKLVPCSFAKWTNHYFSLCKKTKQPHNGSPTS